MAQASDNPVASYSPEMDGKSHEETYSGFSHFTAVGVVFVCCVLVGLAVGGVKHGWLSALFMIIMSLVTTAIGLASPSVSWRAPAVVLVLLLLMLLLY